jgi:hypothetical protein
MSDSDMIDYFNDRYPNIHLTKDSIEFLYTIALYSADTNFRLESSSHFKQAVKVPGIKAIVGDNKIEVASNTLDYIIRKTSQFLKKFDDNEKLIKAKSEFSESNRVYIIYVLFLSTFPSSLLDELNILLNINDKAYKKIIKVCNNKLIKDYNEICNVQSKEEKDRVLVGTTEGFVALLRMINLLSGLNKMEDDFTMTSLVKEGFNMKSHTVLAKSVIDDLQVKDCIKSLLVFCTREDALRIIKLLNYDEPDYLADIKKFSDNSNGEITGYKIPINVIIQKFINSGLIQKVGGKYYIGKNKKLSWSNIINIEFIEGDDSTPLGKKVRDASKRETIRRKWAFWLFRKAIVNSILVGYLEGVKDTKAYSTGSNDITSDYDITLVGPYEEVASVIKNFASIIKDEFSETSGYLFDTNLYGKSFIQYTDTEPSTLSKVKCNTGTVLYYKPYNQNYNESQFIWGLVHCIRSLETVYGSHSMESLFK